MAIVWSQCSFDFIEEPRQEAIEGICIGLYMRVREANWYFIAAIVLHPVIWIITTHEMPRSPDSGLIQNIKQGIRFQVIRVLLHCIGEFLLERADTQISKFCVMLDEVVQQSVEVPQRIIDGRGGHQNELLGRSSLEEFTQRSGTNCVRVSKGLSFIHYNE